MTWTKLGDEFSDDTVDLTDAAFRAHVEALIWSNRKLTDLVIPKKFLPRITAVDEPFTAAEELVNAGWWQDCGQTYYVGCRFSDWQMDRAVIEERREQHALRMRRHRLHKAGDHSMCTEKCSVTRHATSHDAHHDMRDETRSLGYGTGSGRENPKPKLGEEGVLGNDAVRGVQAEQCAVVYPDDRSCDGCGFGPSRITGLGRRVCAGCERGGGA